MITSRDNAKLKEVRALARGRRKGTRFVAEGEDLAAAADAAGWRPVERLVAAGSGLDGTEVEPELLASVSSLGSGTRVIGVYEERFTAELGPLVVALFGVRDPGNVGTVIRSALAFDASVALGPGCADPFGVKAVRASMGSVFRVPLKRLGQEGEELPRPRVALVASLTEPFAGPFDHGTLLVGAEREGLPAEVQASADRRLHIPMPGDAESLNAAMAATVALYEARRASR